MDTINLNYHRNMMQYLRNNATEAWREFIACTNPKFDDSVYAYTAWFTHHYPQLLIAARLAI